jgi:putative transposase
MVEDCLMVMRRRKNIRLPPDCYRGWTLALITICTKNKVPYFGFEGITECGIDTLSEVSALEQFLVPVYCFMPDHVHLLIESRSDESDVRRFVARFKQVSAYRIRKCRPAFAWQRNYHDRVLHTMNGWPNVARYVLENPIRIGLVNDARDYPYSGSIGYSIDDIVEGLI